MKQYFKLFFTPKKLQARRMLKRYLATLPRLESVVNFYDTDCVGLLEASDWSQLEFITRVQGNLISLEDVAACFQGLIKFQKFEHARCDIAQVEGLAFSKSSLVNVKTLDAFALSYCAQYIHDESLRQIHENMKHNEVRINNRVNGDSLSIVLGSSKLYLYNSGGSHHFATARYLAKKMNTPYFIELALNVQRLEVESFNWLKSRYYAWMIKEDINSYVLKNIFEELSLNWAMFSVNPFTHAQNSMVGDSMVIVLKKDECAESVHEIFEDFGGVDFLRLIKTLDNNAIEKTNKLNLN